MHTQESAHPHLPAWMRRTRGEHRWPSTLAVVVAIGLQLLLPNRVVPQAGYLLPVLEVALLIAFSPTDVLPLSRWAKVTMMVQSTVAFTVVVLVVARAVNVLGSSPSVHGATAGTPA